MPASSFLRSQIQATLGAVGGAVLWWRLGSRWAAVIAVFLGALALVAWFSPVRYRPIQRGYDHLTRWVVAGFSWLALALVYFGLFAPFRWFGGLWGKDGLGRSVRPGATSNLRPLAPASPDHFKRQY